MQGKLKDPEGNVLLTMKRNNLYIIGRDQIRGENHLNLEDLYVSRIHGVITCEKEFCYEDAGSRNGSRINDEPLPAGEKTRLRDGDRITIGKSNLVIQLKKGKPGALLPQGVRMRLTEMPGGCRILVQAAGKEHLTFAQRMLERNPDPSLPVPVCSDTEEGICLEYRIQGAVSIIEYFRSERPAAEYRNALDKILQKILSSSELLLDEKGFLMCPETVFITDSGEIRLLYLPCTGLLQEEFHEGLLRVFSCLEEQGPSDFRPVLNKVKEMLQAGGGCWDCYKILHCSGNLTARRHEPDPKKGKKTAMHVIDPGMVLMTLSFLVFLAIYWFAELSVTNLCGAALILAGLNILAAGLRGGERNKPGKHRMKKRTIRSHFTDSSKKAHINQNENNDQKGSLTFLSRL